MIEVRNITKKYGDLVAVDSISFEVAAGELCVLIGPSGCGKTTTLKMINRLLEPTTGDILVDGKSVRDFKPELLRRHIGYVIQSVGLFPHMTVAENIAVIPRLLSWPSQRIDKRIDELVTIIGLGRDYKDKYPWELSGGEAQRIGVARALAADPPILLMDEPFGAVDPLTRERLQVQFVKIQHELKKTVVFVTHDLDEAIRLADKIVLMKEGRIAQHDTPENVLAHPTNKFVRDFVGADRALKRLARFTISDFMTKPKAVRMSVDFPQAIQEAQRDKVLFLWLTDEAGKLLGWIDVSQAIQGARVEDVITRVEPMEIAVLRDSTLREALSRMLGQGIRSVPVVDDESKLVGEISLADVEKVTRR